MSKFIVDDTYIADPGYWVVDNTLLEDGLVVSAVSTSSVIAAMFMEGMVCSALAQSSSTADLVVGGDTVLEASAQAQATVTADLTTALPVFNVNAASQSVVTAELDVGLQVLPLPTLSFVEGTASSIDLTSYFAGYVGYLFIPGALGLPTSITFNPETFSLDYDGGDLGLEEGESYYSDGHQIVIADDAGFSTYAAARPHVTATLTSLADTSLSTNLLAQSGTTANLTSFGDTTLAVNAASDASASGSLTTAIALSAALNAQATVQADMGADGSMYTFATAEAGSSIALATSILMSMDAASVAFVGADLGSLPSPIIVTGPGETQMQSMKDYGADPRVKSAIIELQGLTRRVVTGNSTPNTDLSVTGMLDEDSILSVYDLNASGQPTDVTASTSIRTQKASGTVTVAGVNDNDTVTLNGTVYTFKDTPAGGTHVLRVAGDNNANAAALAVKVNAVEPYKSGGQAVKATVASNVVTFQALARGTSGNSIALASNDGTRLAVSGSTLTGGTANAAIRVSVATTKLDVMFVRKRGAV